MGHLRAIIASHCCLSHAFCTFTPSNLPSCLGLNSLWLHTPHTYDLISVVYQRMGSPWPLWTIDGLEVAAVAQRWGREQRSDARFSMWPMAKWRMDDCDAYRLGLTGGQKATSSSNGSMALLGLDNNGESLQWFSNLHTWSRGFAMRSLSFPKLQLVWMVVDWIMHEDFCWWLGFFLADGNLKQNCCYL
jgi:hypothetical protein